MNHYHPDQPSSPTQHAPQAQTNLVFQFLIDLQVLTEIQETDSSNLTQLLQKKKGENNP